MLITTRKPDLDIKDAKSVEMPSMTEEEALELLLYDPKKPQPSKKDLEEGRELVNMLGFHALAIDQARWWFTEHGMQSYLDAFSSHRAEIIKQHRDGRKQTWFTTFEISLVPFKEQKNVVHLLTLSALLGQGMIWGDYFQYHDEAHSLFSSPVESPTTSLIAWNKEAFHYIIFNLGQKSLVRVRQNRSGPQAGTFYSLHPVVREWLRQRLSDDSCKKYLRSVIGMMSAFIFANENCPLPFQIQLDILTHLDGFQKDREADSILYSTSLPNQPDRPAALVFAAFYRRCSRVKDSQTILNRLLEDRRRTNINDDDLISLDVRIEIGETYVDHSEWKQAKRHITELLATPKLSPEQRCRALIIRAKVEMAESLFSKSGKTALEASNIAKGLKDEVRLEIRAQLLIAVSGAMRGFNTKDRIEHAYNDAKKEWGREDASTLEAAMVKGYALAHIWPPGVAKRWIEDVIDNAEELHGPEHWLTLNAIVALGRVSLRSGYFEEARAHYSLVQSRITTLFGESANAVSIQTSVAETYYREQRYGEAEHELLTAKKLSDRIDDPVSRRHVLYGLFQVYFWSGRIFKALPHLLQVIGTFNPVATVRGNKGVAAPLFIFIILWTISALRSSLVTFMATVAVLFIIVII